MPVFTPPFIPQFGTGAPGGTVPTTAIYYDVSTTPYTPYIFHTGAWHKFGATGSGANATSIQGVNVDPTPPMLGQVLEFNGTDWIPNTAGSAGINEIGAGIINAGQGFSAAFNNGAFGCKMIVPQGDAVVNSLKIWGSTLGNSVSIAPAIYDVNADNSMGNLLMTGPVVTGIPTPGILKFPFTSGFALTHATPIYAGIGLLTNQLFTPPTDPQHIAAFSMSSFPVPGTPSGVSYVSAGFGIMWLSTDP